MLEPFLKWAGGKRWLVQTCPELLPTSFNTYYEPFLGGGALFFHLRPSRALLSDRNGDLINAYREVRDHPERIALHLKRYQRLHKPSFYYAIRSRQFSETIRRAARFIYLNRTCFNGLYRVNRRGDFNVPIGTKCQVEFRTGFLQEVSTALRGAILSVVDFEETVNTAGKGDFVYVDPPYTVMHNANNFVKYNAVLFSWDDQCRLAKAVLRADRRGALVAVSNADHESIRELYERFGTAKKLHRASIIAGGSGHRTRASELLITNY